MYTVKEAAEKTGISPHTAKKYAHPDSKDAPRGAYLLAERCAKGIKPPDCRQQFTPEIEQTP